MHYEQKYSPQSSPESTPTPHDDTTITFKLNHTPHFKYLNHPLTYVKIKVYQGVIMTCVLKPITTQAQWGHYHRIVKSQIFDAHREIIYDENHPSLKDANKTFYLLYKNQEVIGTIIIEHYSSQLAILRVVAIDLPYQKQGYGTVLLNCAEEIITHKNYKKILLHASPTAVAFYQKHAYVAMDFSFDPKTFADTIDMGKVL
jgi:N-acetylglutamate synthase-like GNAT family acetyltransferase